MKVGVESSVGDAPPPRAVMRIVNPMMRFVLRTPLARLIRPLALLDFEGRRTGRHRQVVVGWHLIEGAPVVVTPAAWRVNFAEARVATIRWRGRESSWVGTLETDPSIVARLVEQMFASGTAARSLALRVPTGHTLTPSDIVETRRGIIRFAPATTP